MGLLADGQRTSRQLLCVTVCLAVVAALGAEQPVELGDSLARAGSNEALNALGAALQPIDKLAKVNTITESADSLGGSQESTADPSSNSEIQDKSAETSGSTAEELKKASRDKVASEAAKEAIDAEKKIEQDETDVQQRKIEDLAKENEEADKKQFEYEKQRAMKKKEAEEKMRRQEEHMRRTEHDFKKAAYEEASHQQSKAAARAEEQAKYANLLDQKVTQLKAKVEDLKTDNTKAQEKLKTERSALLDTNAKRKAAKLKYDEAESRYNAERKIVDETRANAEDSADDLAKLRIALLKAEDQRDSTKDKAQHAQEEKVFADKQAMERKRELESHNSTNATMLDESLMVEML